MDAYDDEWKDSESESDLEDSQPTGFKPSYVLIAIDIDDEMFATSDSNRSPFMDCLDACYEVANALVLADRGTVKGPLGIILADNERTRASFVDFDKPVPETVQLLKELKKLPNEELKLKYQRKGDFDLADFFLLCKNKLMDINADVYKRTVVYITNDDTPIKNEPRKRFNTINELQKFASIQMELNVITFKASFDHEAFYSEVLSECKCPQVEEVKSSVSLSDKLVPLVKKKYLKNRAKLYPFRGDTDSYVEVVINKFVKSLNISKNMYVTRDTQQEVKKSVKRQEYTGDYQCTYAKSEPPLQVTENEKENFTETNLPIGYTLLCVGEETVKKGWVIESPSLMEKHYKEAQPVFDYFWQFCKDKLKCLICLRKYRRGGDVRVVELVPKFINNTRMFLVRVVPFGPEIHYSIKPVQEDISFKKHEEDVMSLVVEALTFDFDPLNFTDPVTGKKKAYIKSQLLEESMEEVDEGIPSDEQLDERLSLYIKELEDLEVADAPSVTKRGRGVKQGGTQKKLKGA